MNNKTRPLPWSDLDKIRIKMIKNDIWQFGPTILYAGKEYVLPEIDANYFIDNGTAERIIE